MSTIGGRPCETRFFERSSLNSEWCTEVQEVGPGLCVARAVVPRRLDKLPIVVRNVSQEATILDAGADLAELTPVVVELGTGLEDGSEQEGDEVEVRAVSTNQADVGEVKEQAVAPGYELEQLLEGLSPKVTTAEREALWKQLEVFRDIFSRNGDDLGETDLGVHCIDTGDARPIRQSLRRHPRHMLQDIDDQVKKLVESGVVEASASEWAFNLVMVKKGDGTYRMCVDLRGLNVRPL